MEEQVRTKRKYTKSGKPQGARRTQKVTKLAEVRLATGLTQAQFSEAAGVSCRSLVQWELGLSDPGVVPAIKVARQLGMSVEELFADRVENK